ncbi:hypothetical protein DU002_13265 [Corallincola holothuriorum]|uniref:Lipoprotein n=1 Tax=Corallincola holothuriorum TaxID=2282215 RepID=A0A368NE37_9GAMM|nr:hypothetical protein [Corallincola holothuriorum]RCU48758.1 hypothetical protein DU002_13265 [Corallincola holothuriorum]
MKYSQLPMVFTLLLLFGCSEWSELKTIQEDGEIFFTADNFANTKVAFDTMTVRKMDCEVDCTYWQALRPVEKDNLPHTYSEANIRYGQQLENITDIVPPKALEAGKYQVSGMLFYKNINGELSGGGRFSGEFELKLVGKKLVLITD